MKAKWLSDLCRPSHTIQFLLNASRTFDNLAKLNIVKIPYVANLTDRKKTFESDTTGSGRYGSFQKPEAVRLMTVIGALSGLSAAENVRGGFCQKQTFAGGDVNDFIRSKNRQYLFSEQAMPGAISVAVNIFRQ